MVHGAGPWSGVGLLSPCRPGCGVRHLRKQGRMGSWVASGRKGPVFFPVRRSRGVNRKTSGGNEGLAIGAERWFAGAWVARGLVLAGGPLCGTGQRGNSLGLPESILS